MSTQTNRVKLSHLFDIDERQQIMLDFGAQGCIPAYIHRFAHGLTWKENDPLEYNVSQAQTLLARLSARQVKT